MRTVTWTDGKCEARLLPRETWLLKNPSDGVLFWADEVEDVSQSKADVPYAENPKEDDYFLAACRTEKTAPRAAFS